MRLGLTLSYWGAGDDGGNLALAKEADRLGYSVVWAAEAYGSDTPTVLAWIGAHTERIDVGAGVMQIPARTPAMTAMTAATLDSLTGGRFRLGLGVSGPQVSEGWHGVRFDKPLGRTEEYVQIVRTALARRRVRFEGEHYTLPLPDGPGKALTLTVHPVREHIPVYLAALGPKNLELAGRIADGWLALFLAPDHAEQHLARVRAGRAAAGAGGADDVLDGFDVSATVPLSVGADVDACADPVRAWTALYVGGMGSRTANFYHAQATALGYGEQADRVQQLYLSREKDAAEAAVPVGLIDRVSLLGPVDRISERMTQFAAAGVTTLCVSPYGADLPARLASLEQAADALQKSGVGE